MSPIRINDLLGSADNSEVLSEQGITFKVERVLHLDAELDTLVLIDRYGKKALPFTTPLSAIESLVSGGSVRIFEDLEREDLLVSAEDNQFARENYGFDR